MQCRRHYNILRQSTFALLLLLLAVSPISAFSLQPVSTRRTNNVSRDNGRQTVMSSARVKKFRRRGGRSTAYTSTLLSSSSPSSSNVDDDNGKVPRGGSEGAPTALSQPTLREILRFALPCLGLWISGPLLSLVDTMSVGLTAKAGAGAQSLGALGPATTFIDGATYLFAFLNVATTNLYAGALARNERREGKDRLDPREAGDGVVRTASKISLTCGVLVMGLLLKFGRTLLGLYIGCGSSETAIGGDVARCSMLEPATKYVNIRGLSMPTSLLYGVLQAALLGARDSVTPLVAVVCSTIVNVLGDGYLVVIKGMGVEGAAIATLAAQLAGTAAMIGPARRILFSSKSKSKESKSVEDDGVIQKDDADVIGVRTFLKFAAPVLTLIIGKISAFGIMTHVAASLPAPASLAAHQLALSLFFFVSPFLEVVSQTAQTFLPQFYQGDNGDSDGREAKILSARLLRIGSIVGIIVASLASLVLGYMPSILTNDPIVRTAVRPLALPLFLGCALTAPVAVSEGVLLARRELKFLAGTYLASTAVFPFALLGIKRMGGPVVDVWYGFALFQLFRAACFTGRLWGRDIWKGMSRKS